LNITWYEAMKGTLNGEDAYQFARFLCSQTIMMALEGIPAFYIHSLMGTPNDVAGYEKTGQKRALNRKQWDYATLRTHLDDSRSLHAKVLSTLKSRIAVRTAQPAFHPNATQFTMQFGDELFGFWRQSLDRSQSIFAIHNVTAQRVTVPALAINLIDGEHWIDLLSGDAIDADTGDILFEPYQCRWISNRRG
jgi:sucrose phosphorylase